MILIEFGLRVMSLKKSGLYLATMILALMFGGSISYANTAWHSSWSTIIGDQNRQARPHDQLLKVQQQSIQLEFVNGFQQPVDYYMVNPNTNEPQFLNTIAPGQSMVVQSTPGLRWLFGQNQNQIQSYDTQLAPFQRVVVAPKGQQGRFQTQFPQTSGGQPTGQSQPQTRNGVVVPAVPRATQQAQPRQQAPQVQQPFQPRTGPQQPAPQVFNPGGSTLGNQPNQPQTAQPFQPAQPRQVGSGIPRLQAQQQGGLRQPAQLYEIGITLDICRRARFAAGAPQNEICQYLGQLANVDPAAYQRYLAQIQVLKQTRDRIATERGGTDIGSPSGSGEVASWGGVVRSGPGMETNRVDSLREGEAVEILQDSGVRMNGYNWFQIRYRGNKTGYQWGGIMCGRSQPVPGVYEVCN